MTPEAIDALLRERYGESYGRPWPRVPFDDHCICRHCRGVCLCEPLSENESKKR